MRKNMLTALTLVTALTLGASAFAATAPENHSAAAPTATAQAQTTALNAIANNNHLKNTGTHVAAVTGTQVAATVNTLNKDAANFEPNAKINTGNEEAVNLTANSTDINTPTALAKNPDELNGQAATRAGTNINGAIAVSNTNTANIAAMHTDAFNATNNTANLNRNAPLRTDETAANANANNLTLTNTAALHYTAFNAGTANTLNNYTAPDVIPNAYAGALKTVATTTSPGGAHVINATFKVNNKAWATAAQIA